MNSFLPPIKKALFLTLLLSTLPLFADIIELKSGKIYQGEIISENDTSYTIKTHPTPSISDERDIRKDQIKKISKESPSNKAFEDIKPLVKTPDLLSPKSYTYRITQVEQFLKKHPLSAHRKEAQTILKSLKKEQDIINAGGVKLRGIIIPASKKNANAYDIDAYILMGKIKKYAHRGQYHLALRSWETLKTNNLHSKALQESLPLIKRILKSYKQKLTNNLASLDTRLTQQQKVIETLEPNDQDRAKALIQETQLRFDAIQKKERANKTKWLTPNFFNKANMTTNLHNVDQEIIKVSKLLKSPPELAGSAYRTTYSALEKEDLALAKTSLEKLIKLKTPPLYIHQFSLLIKKKEADLKAAQLTAKKKEEEKVKKEKEATEKTAKDEAQKKETKKTHRRGKKNK